MTTKKKDWLEKAFVCGINHPGRSILILLLILLLTGVFTQLSIQSLYCLGKWKGIPTDFSAGEVLMFWGSFFTFMGTFALGALAYGQNKKLNDINDRLLEIEEAKLCPMIDISLCQEFKIFSGEVKSTKQVIMVTLDDNYCEVTSNNEIINHHGDMTWVFECENTSEVKIVALEIIALAVTYHYQNGKEDFFTPKISSHGDECLNPHENKPIIISGIKSFSHEDPNYSNPRIDMALKVLCTNAVGDKYKQNIDLWVVDWLANDVSYPGIFEKKYSKPQKIKTNEQ